MIITLTENSKNDIFKSAWAPAANGCSSAYPNPLLPPRLRPPRSDFRRRGTGSIIPLRPGSFQWSFTGRERKVRQQVIPCVLICFQFPTVLQGWWDPGCKGQAWRWNAGLLEDSRCSVHVYWPAHGSAAERSLLHHRSSGRRKGERGRVPSTVCTPRGLANEQQDLQVLRRVLSIHMALRTHDLHSEKNWAASTGILRTTPSLRPLC